jgi:hypothetical protein
MNDYENRTVDRIPGKNVYKENCGFNYSVDEAVHWVGGDIEVPAIQFLKEQGLQPHHTFLEVGAGCFRCSVPMIEYLDEGHYFAIDGDRNLLERGLNEVVPEQLQKKVQMAVSWDFEFDLLEQNSFD